MQHLIMQPVLLHAKSSPSHWRSIAFSSHLCGLSRGQGWRFFSFGQNVDLTPHFLTQLQCVPPLSYATWRSASELCSMPAIHLPRTSYSNSTCGRSSAPRSRFYSVLLSHVLPPMSPDPSLQHHSSASPCGMKSSCSPHRAQGTRPFS